MLLLEGDKKEEHVYTGPDILLLWYMVIQHALYVQYVP